MANCSFVFYPTFFHADVKFCLLHPLKSNRQQTFISSVANVTHKLALKILVQEASSVVLRDKVQWLNYYNMNPQLETHDQILLKHSHQYI